MQKEASINQDQLMSMVRWVVTAGCGWLVSKGWLNDSLVEGIIGVALALAALGWSMVTHSKPETLKAAARVDPAIRIEVPEHVATSYPSIRQLTDNPIWGQVVRRESEPKQQ